jgi:hypothetical protein
MPRIDASFQVSSTMIALGRSFASLLLAALVGGSSLCLAEQPVDAVALVRRASQNELGSSNGQPFRYRLHKVDDKSDTTKEIVETAHDGDVARLIAIGGKPLTPEQEKSELSRLDNLLNHPEVQEHRHKREKEDSDRANKMIRLLPDAFLYKYEGMVEGSSGPAYRLTFQPNPNFQPPDREAQVYHGMTGELWVDKAQERMVRLDAHLIADVEFGWGILGKLYKGGSILVEQADVGDHHWEATHMKLDLTGKALMFKSLTFKTVEDSSDFQPVPREWTYKDAVHLLQTNPTTGPETASGGGHRR